MAMNLLTAELIIAILNIELRRSPWLVARRLGNSLNFKKAPGSTLLCAVNLRRPSGLAGRWSVSGFSSLIVGKIAPPNYSLIPKSIRFYKKWSDLLRWFVIDPRILAG
jgi:hypothetical protein